MIAAREPIHTLTAEDVMNREVVVVPLQISVREAACLIHRARVTEAAVVDQHGHCVAILSLEDILRWVEAGCPEAAVRPAGTCPYQFRGCLPTGGEAVICVLGHGSCPYQTSYPGLGGRHTEVCLRPETADSPFGTVPRYMTTDVVTVRPETPLSELVQQFLDTGAGHVFVLDECERPVGTVSAADVLKAVADAPERKNRSAGKP
jgi:CBS-domain-containing membrane protein